MTFVSKFLRSLRTAFSGLGYAIRSERNMRIHVVAGVAVVVAGFAFELAIGEWIAIVLCIGLVMAAECANTALERLADRVSLEIHPLIGQAKDCSSAAVLTLSLTAGTVGVLVFAPKIRMAFGW